MSLYAPKPGETLIDDAGHIYEFTTPRSPTVLDFRLVSCIVTVDGTEPVRVWGQHVKRYGIRDLTPEEAALWRETKEILRGAKHA